MKRLQVWAVIYVVLAIAFIAAVLSSGPGMPERIATHFNAAGQPDGWMQKPSYLYLTLGVGLGVPAFLVLVFYLARFMPDCTINLPNKAYWLAPEQRPFTNAYMVLQGLILGCFMLLFFAGLHFLTVLANRIEPVRLSGVGTVVLIGAFIAAIGVWVLRFYRRFR